MLKKSFILTILFFSLSVALAQDKVLVRDFENNSFPYAVKILSYDQDTFSYCHDFGRVRKIPARDVIAFKKNYADKQALYVYLRPQDERIFGIKDDKLFYKADYRFTTSNAELAKECYLAKFRIYDEDVQAGTDYHLFVCNDSTGEEVKIPGNFKFYISFKDDMLNRNIQARLYQTTEDISQFIVKIEANETNYLYRINVKDIKAIGIESAGARIGKITVDALSYGNSRYYYEERWYTRYLMDQWHVCSGGK